METGKMSQREINAATTWSANDQYPSFEDCEKFQSDAQRTCFATIVVDSIKSYLENVQLIAVGDINERITLTIILNKEGYFSLSNIEGSTSILESISNLEAVLYDAVNTLPKAFPALKSNVGEFVDTQFTLPIQINTTKYN